MTNCKQYNKKNIGKKFKFVIQKQITFPDDDQAYFIIRDKQGCKFTIPIKPYLSYQLNIGQPITCKLDQINCDGKIFFEPQHPYYEEGRFYEFAVIEYKIIENYLGLQEHIIVVSDKLNNEQWVRYSNTLIPIENKITAWVEKIKKGRLFLLPHKNNTYLLKPGNKYRFRVSGKLDTERFGQVYLITDELGNLHSIPIKYYLKYKLDQQDYFWATIKRFSSKGFFYIEPDHPLYQIDKQYGFTIIDKIIEDGQSTYFVEDQLKNMASFRSSKMYNISDAVTCHVLGLKKGRLILNTQE